MLRKYGILPALLMVALSLSGFTYLPSSEGEGNPWFIWLIVLVVLAAFVAFMIWWWIYADKGDKDEAPPARNTVVDVLEPEPEAAPEAEAAPEPVEPDDLKRIEGIGPKISSVLQAAGISTFAQLAATDADQIKQVLEDENPNLLRLADPTSWPQQATLAAAGDWEGLEALQDALHGGRHT